MSGNNSVRHTGRASVAVPSQREPASAPAGPPGGPGGPSRSGGGTYPGRPRRRPRWGRIFLVLGIGALVLALVAAGGGYLWYRSVSNDIDRTDPFAGITGDRPAKAVEGAMNILMLGSDSRDPDNKAKAGEWRTDTMLIAHIPADHKKAYLISIPRDLYVYIPKSPTNPDLGNRKAKINAAFAWGGLPLTVQTVEGFTGLRMDHVMGLSRLWWIPAGMSPLQGAYVRYDAEAMLGVLAGSAAAAGAIAIGEDLGTVEPWLREALPAQGVLGTSMLWFERGWAGEPLAPQWWRRNCLATVSTHDMPPAAAFLTGSHVTDRVTHGLLTRHENEEHAEAAKTVDSWLEALYGEGLLPAGSRPDADAFTAALYSYLARTPALLIGVSLAEAAGERRSQNIPGTTTEYPNWRVPLCGPDGSPVPLEDLQSSDRVRTIARAAAS